MKTAKILALCLALSILAFAACSNREKQIYSASPSQNSKVSVLSSGSAAPEDVSEPAADTQPITEEAFPHSPGKEQLAEMERAAALITAFEWPEDVWDNFDALEPLADELAALGVTVHYKDNWRDYNAEKVRAFAQTAQTGGDAAATVVYLRTYPGISLPRAYYTEGPDIYSCSMELQENGEVILSTPEQLDKETVTITEYGHFFGAEPTSFRVEPLPQENLDAYWNYVKPVGNDLSLRDNWRPEAFVQSFPLFVFEALCFYENPDYISGKSPYLSQTEDWVFSFPAEVVDELFLRYFGIPAGAMRSNRIYSAAENIYRVEAFQGGGAYSRLEVWNVEERPDGTVAISVGFVSGADERWGELSAILTIKPTADGGFTYLSNEALAIR